MLKGLAPVTLSKTACYYQRNGLSLREKRRFAKEISPSPRTASSLPTDCESEPLGLGVCINRTEREF